ncbi:LEAF RUST 10 DISEASE-RESISTANCE LOCUS RECEPTOR-LIKE PROTEIN KINASE-like 2.1 [Sesamum angolense]|uniref:LEAF RUST 10 DISEASE-RESISTANCE LOCUS RECEPTOR-LIKE PROTEIN KINASE-like 2.1 n=1 Tax=Sesamum angolense TaxID=2727404 RepID=A0AAE2C5T2_9LAMI|nr:LEAF RUST 10 DISEASE-RESISTANCE LOCUS RECEPTOR-LIKE PROTEIN KINASE-like 2.1 [Sesamum angolense]
MSIGSVERGDIGVDIAGPSTTYTPQDYYVPQPPQDYYVPQPSQDDWFQSTSYMSSHAEAYSSHVDLDLGLVLQHHQENGVEAKAARVGNFNPTRKIRPGPVPHGEGVWDVIFRVRGGSGAGFSSPGRVRGGAGTVSHPPGVANPFTTPFPSQPEACGVPSCQLLNCDGDFPLLYISPLMYLVLEFDFSNQILKVARQDLLGDACPTTPYNTTLQDPYQFAPDSNDLNITLFFNCFIDKNGKRTKFVNQFGCISMFGAGDASSSPGPNITCTYSIYVPIKPVASNNVLQKALARGFHIEWLTVKPRECTYYTKCIRDAPGLATAPSPIYPEEPLGIPPAQSPGSSISNGIPPAQSTGYVPGSTISNGRGQLPSFYIVVAVSGTGVVILSIIICCCYLKRRSGPAGHHKENIENFLILHGSLAPSRYKYSEIKKITKSFKDKLGQGGFGSVYQGMLPDGSPVAVKVLINSDSNGEEFINEVASISRTSHVNIVNLLGFCYDGNKKALVYEFMPNKSLDKFISNNADSQLDWERLYKIAVGVAKGLEYLHTGCNTRIVHFDIKPQNILLDDDFCPKISDFGLAKLCKKKQSILSVLGARGTIGYIAPEVFSRNFGGVSHKSDVYSYGMMVLEMVGAKKIVEPEATQSSENYFPDRIYEQVVVNVSTNSNDLMIEEEETTRKMFLVGFWCIQTNPSDRPRMSKVVEMLEGSVQSIPIPPKPVLFTPTLPTSAPEFSSYEIENSIISAANCHIMGIGNIRYPFWVDGVQPEECGHSGFQLFNCKGAFPVLDIQPLRYHVLELNFSSRTLNVAREDLLKNACSEVLYNTTLNGLYDFAPDSNYENITLFFGCVRLRKNESKTNLPNQFACIDLFRTGNTSFGPGPNNKCKDSISVPMNGARPGL